MHRPHLLLAALCCASTLFAQQTDTLIIHYKPDQYSISRNEKTKLDSFLIAGWDRILINGYTDETEGEEYNLELSRKRSGEVYSYLVSKNIPIGSIAPQHFGEAMPKADNDTEMGKALNRRTEIIGMRFPKVKVKPPVPAVDLMLPVTRTLDNGIIITYRPGMIPDYLATNWSEGSGSNIRMLSNTTQMRQNNLYNNTTNGEILSSVMIICGDRLSPCKLDSPILIRVPVPYQTKCPVSKVKFFNAVYEKGKRIWKEETRLITAETINGTQYLGVWVNDLCECINFDFKIDPDCFEVDSTRVLYTKGTIRNMTAELIGYNSVYMPNKINDSTHILLFMKNKIKDAPLSFALYDGSRRVRGYKDKRLTSFHFDKESGQYLLRAAKQNLYFHRMDVWDVVLKVNGDRYRVPGDKNRYAFTYLSYREDSILVDFSVMESRNRMTRYQNQPIGSLPFDKEKNCYMIDKKFIKELKQKTTLAKE